MLEAQSLEPKAQTVSQCWELGVGAGSWGLGAGGWELGAAPTYLSSVAVM